MSSKLKASLLIAATATLGLIGTTTISQASATLPKSYHGTWYAPAQYINGMKHTKANIAMPAVKMSVHSKAVYWRFYGTLPKDGVHYTHKTHKLTIATFKYNDAILKGHGPYRNYNELAKMKSHLYLGFKGGQYIFHKYPS